ncbi:MAG: hypothetical protein NT080_06135 [Spirochaetes bacterium]|nr:hypothetical protein [Spirochaetota bacterium]
MMKPRILAALLATIAAAHVAGADKGSALRPFVRLGLESTFDVSGGLSESGGSAQAGVDAGPVRIGASVDAGFSGSGFARCSGFFLAGLSEGLEAQAGVEYAAGEKGVRPAFALRVEILRGGGPFGLSAFLRFADASAFGTRGPLDFGEFASGTRLGIALAWSPGFRTGK